MYVDKVKNIKSVKLEAPGIANVLKRVLVGPQQGWEGWVMRHFTLGAAGYTPRHTHLWPHIIYILSGNGTLLLGEKEHEVKTGSTAYIPGGAEHQFRNPAGEDFSFICIVPEEGDV
ncbi:MAG: cupin domain-containing protein [Desulfotomaculaceae bacterium]